MSDPLPFSQACENNKDPILEVLRRHLSAVTKVLEIGSGTGQHAVHFATALAHLEWQATDIPENLAALNLRVLDAGLANVPLALPLDVSDRAMWETEHSVPQAIFSANSLHIMSEARVDGFFALVADLLPAQGLLLVYGPFKYGGDFTTDSNARFDVWLKQRDSLSGVRDFERVQQRAQQNGFSLLEDNAMPANNQLLVWQRKIIPG